MIPPFSWMAKWRRRRQTDATMTEEFALHLELLTAENVRRGLSPDEARLAARRSFGGIEQIKEQCRDARGWVWLSQLQQDLRYAFRSLLAQPAFTLAAVLTLAIGIGANTTVLSIIQDMMLRPAALRQGGRIVALHTRATDGDHGFRRFSYREFQTLQSATRLFAQVAAMDLVPTTLGTGDNVELRTVGSVSADYFSALGILPWRGRFFTAAECDPRAQPRVVVASYELWRRLGQPGDLVGSLLRIDGVDFTVVGIAPIGFGGLQWSLGPDAWVPLGFLARAAGPNPLLDAGQHRLQVFAQLAPGLSLDQAQAELPPLSARLNEQDGSTFTHPRKLSLSPPSGGNLDLTVPTDESGFAVYGVAAGVLTLLVLVIASLNVAHMLFARGVARRKEIAIRLCLGASRGRVIRQLLVEGLVLATIGGAAGLVCEQATYGPLLDAARQHAGPVTMHLQNRTDWILLGATGALSLFATLCFALFPALRATRTNLVEDLKGAGGLPAAGGSVARFFALRHCLVMTQVALSVVLLFVTVILVRAVRSSELARGFEVDGRVIASVDYGLARTPNDQVAPKQRALLEAVSRLPGVEAAALASAMPYNFESNWWSVFAVGTAAGALRAADGGDGSRGAICTFVSDRYFDAMGIAVRAGRAFTAAEAMTRGGRPLAIIDESLARQLFGRTDPIGQHVALSAAERDAKDGRGQFEIVGIVHSPREDALWGGNDVPRIYRPFAQAPGTVHATYLPVKLAAGAGAASTLAAIRRAARRVDPRVPVLRSESLQAFVNDNLNTYTVHTLEGLFAVFGLVSCALAVVGVYGVKAHTVARRAREIGIRIAVGARPGDVLRLLLRQTLGQTLLGVSAGAAIALLFGMLLAHLIYQVSPFEPIALATAALPVAAAALAASLIPAHRATRIDPTAALRSE